MKITEQSLKKLVLESVKKLVSESFDGGINWDNLTYLNKSGGLSRLSPKWQVILKARELADKDIEKTLAILKAAVATLEASKSHVSPAAEKQGGELGSLDMASLVNDK